MTCSIIFEGEPAGSCVLSLLIANLILFVLSREAGSVILKIIYGYTTVPHGQDPLVELAGKTMAQFADAITPGRWSVDVFPFREFCVSCTLSIQN